MNGLLSETNYFAKQKKKKFHHIHIYVEFATIYRTELQMKFRKNTLPQQVLGASHQHTGADSVEVKLRKALVEAEMIPLLDWWWSDLAASWIENWGSLVKTEWTRKRQTNTDLHWWILDGFCNTRWVWDGAWNWRWPPYWAALFRGQSLSFRSIILIQLPIFISLRQQHNF